METDINQLVPAARRGDREAATRIIELSYERIYTFLRRLTGHEAEACDLTQATFRRVWQTLPTFAGRSSVICWIHCIAYHAYIDWRRSGSRTEARSEQWWATHAAPEVAPDEQAACSDLASRLHAAVDRLESPLRETAQLHYYQGLTLQETADAMKVAPSTVKYRLRQALAELQDEFAEVPAPARSI